jgi:hypothetical protein
MPEHCAGIAEHRVTHRNCVRVEIRKRSEIAGFSGERSSVEGFVHFGSVMPRRVS